MQLVNELISTTYVYFFFKKVFDKFFINSSLPKWNTGLICDGFQGFLGASGLFTIYTKISVILDRKLMEHTLLVDSIGYNY